MLRVSTCSSAFHCSSSSSANVAVELDSSFASGKYRESGFNRAWQDEFPWLLFTTEHAVKLRLQLQIFCCYFINDIRSRPPCLNSNLEEKLNEQIVN